MKPPPAVAQDHALTEAQLGAALQLLGLKPEPPSPLGTVRSVSDPSRVVRGTPLVGAAGNAVVSGLAELLRRAAAPERVVSFVVSTSGESGVRRVDICHQGQAPGGKGVAVEKSPEGTYRLQPLADVDAAVAHLGALVPTSERAASGEANGIRLTLPAYGALLAAADATQMAALRLRLARGNAIKPVLMPTVLDRALDDGLRHDDSRWAVSASRLTSSVNLVQIKGAMPNGLQDLAYAGVVKPIARGFALTSDGERAIAALSELRCTAHVALFVARQLPSLPAAQATFFVGSRGAAAAKWTEVNDAGATGEWVSLGSTEIAAYIRGLFALEPPPVARSRPAAKKDTEQKARACPACHAPAATDARFCSACGADLNEPSQRRCSNLDCRQPIPAGRKFCTACGTRVEAEKTR